ncbi:MAG TPA: hypothetical protein VN456_09550 [Desulfosporosinus sp.]|nr:hypothetical protein [Desulfosporosinus sp.]
MRKPELINTVSTEEILREAEAVKVEKAVNDACLSFFPFGLIFHVFNKVKGGQGGERCFSLGAIYMLGYMHGVRAERIRRRKKKSVA